MAGRAGPSRIALTQGNARGHAWGHARGVEDVRGAGGEPGVLTLFAVLMAVAGLVLAALAAYVAWRRQNRMGWSLAVLLVAVAWWGLAYSVELSVDDVATKSRWGDLKYIGVVTLAPAWLVFVLQYTGRGRLV